MRRQSSTDFSSTKLRCCQNGNATAHTECAGRTHKNLCACSLGTLVLDYSFFHSFFVGVRKECPGRLFFCLAARCGRTTQTHTESSVSWDTFFSAHTKKAGENTQRHTEAREHNMCNTQNVRFLFWDFGRVVVCVVVFQLFCNTANSNHTTFGLSFEKGFFWHKHSTRPVSGASRVTLVRGASAGQGPP